MLTGWIGRMHRRVVPVPRPAPRVVKKLSPAICHNILDFSARVLATGSVEHPTGLTSPLSFNARDPEQVSNSATNFARDISLSVNPMVHMFEAYHGQRDCGINDFGHPPNG